MKEPRKFRCKEMVVEAGHFTPTADTWPKGVVFDQERCLWKFGDKPIWPGTWAITLPNGEKVSCSDEFFREMFQREAS